MHVDGLAGQPVPDDPGQLVGRHARRVGEAGQGDVDGGLPVDSHAQRRRPAQVAIDPPGRLVLAGEAEHDRRPVGITDVGPAVDPESGESVGGFVQRVPVEGDLSCTDPRPAVVGDEEDRARRLPDGGVSLELTGHGRRHGGRGEADDVGHGHGADGHAVGGVERHDERGAVDREGQRVALGEDERRRNPGGEPDPFPPRAHVAAGQQPEAPGTLRVPDRQVGGDRRRGRRGRRRGRRGRRGEHPELERSPQWLDTHPLALTAGHAPQPSVAGMEQATGPIRVALGLGHERRAVRQLETDLAERERPVGGRRTREQHVEQRRELEREEAPVPRDVHAIGVVGVEDGVAAVGPEDPLPRQAAGAQHGAVVLQAAGHDAGERDVLGDVVELGPADAVVALVPSHRAPRDRPGRIGEEPLPMDRGGAGAPVQAPGDAGVGGDPALDRVAGQHDVVEVGEVAVEALVAQLPAHDPPPRHVGDGGGVGVVRHEQVQLLPGDDDGRLGGVNGQHEVVAALLLLEHRRIVRQAVPADRADVDVGGIEGAEDPEMAAVLAGPAHVGRGRSRRRHRDLPRRRPRQVGGPSRDDDGCVRGVADLGVGRGRRRRQPDDPARAVGARPDHEEQPGAGEGDVRVVDAGAQLRPVRPTVRRPERPVGPDGPAVLVVGGVDGDGLETPRDVGIGHVSAVVGPGQAGVVGNEDAEAANADVAGRHRLAGRRVQPFRSTRRDGQGGDLHARLVVPQRAPAGAAVGRLPHPATG